LVRKMFGPNREEVTRRGIKMHNEYLNDLNCSPYNHCDYDVKEGEIGGTCVTYWGEKRIQTDFRRENLK
jgi:hypothetical protein